MLKKDISNIDPETKDRVIRAAWEDEVPFESIAMQFGFTESQVIKIMKTVMKPKMFVVWRKRVRGRITKHSALMQTYEK